MHAPRTGKVGKLILILVMVFSLLFITICICFGVLFAWSETPSVKATVSSSFATKTVLASTHAIATAKVIKEKEEIKFTSDSATSIAIATAEKQRADNISLAETKRVEVATAIANATAVSATETARPTSTPTQALIFSFPLIVRNESFSFVVKDIKFLDLITGNDAKQPKNGLYIVFLGEMKNILSEYECVSGNDFILKGEEMMYEGDSSLYGAYHELTGIDYPGFFMGQCLDGYQAEDSFLIFDIPSSEDNYQLWFGQINVPLGQLYYLRNPLPTPTRTPTSTTTPSLTPSPTPPVAAIGSKDIYLYSGPNTKLPIIFPLTKGTSVYVLGKNEDASWVLVDHNGIQGWAQTQDLLLPDTLEAVQTSSAVIPTLTPSITPTSTGTPTPTQSPTPSFVDKPPVGTWCEGGDSVGICSFVDKYSNSLGYSVAPRGYRYIVIGIVAQNFGLLDTSISPLDFRLIMDNGYTYNYVSESYYYGNALETTLVSPGNKVAGVIVFQVPNNVSPKELIFDENLFSRIIINFHKPPTP